MAQANKSLTGGWGWMSNKIMQVIERTGIVVFCVSSLIMTQFHVVKKFQKYAELEIRFALALFLGILLGLGVIGLIKILARKASKDVDVFLADLSVVLFPGVLFLFASADKKFVLVGLASCSFAALWVWVKPVRDFIKAVFYQDKFRNTLSIDGRSALIQVTGIYEKADLPTMQSFLLDLALNIHECAKEQITEVRIEFVELKGNEANELKLLIEAVAKYFDVRALCQQ